LLLKTQEVEAKVEDLVFATKGMEFQVTNTFNEFLMLSNTQFVENVIFFILFNLSI